MHSQTGERRHRRLAGTLLLASGAESVAAAFDGKLTETLALLGATGGAGEVTKLATLGTVTAPVVAAVGLGPEPTGRRPGAGDAAPGRRRGGPGAGRRRRGSRWRCRCPTTPTPPAALRAVAEGALLGGYRFAGYKTKPQPARRDAGGRGRWSRVPDAARRDRAGGGRRGPAVVGAAVARARDWVNTAPNELRPPAFADAGRRGRRATPGSASRCSTRRRCATGGYGGILAVGQGSEAPPRLVKLDLHPGRAAAGKRVALVGKGITFDTGGISIKPAQGMWEMKSDMAGAAAVAATMLAVAALKPTVAVTAYLPMAENMPSGTAYRPGDVVTMYNGKRVEVLNTDAEGRMILGDAIARACEDGSDYLFETSTLTGGQVVALGKRIAGVMGTAGAVRAGPGRRRRGRRAGLADAAAGRRPQGHGLRRRRHLAGQRRHGPGRAHAAGRRLPARVRHRRTWPGRTSTSPGRATTPASRPATGPRAAPASRCARCSQLIDDIAANG